MSIDSLSPREIKALKLSLLSEHFQFSPETFAAEGQDVVNTSIYLATESLEGILMERIQAKEGLRFEDEEMIEAGIYKLETLLESAVDKSFDLFEIYIFRNAFALKSEIIPYLILPHQIGLTDSLLDADQAAIDEYELEKSLYEAELKKEQSLNSVTEFLERKLNKLAEKSEQIGWLASTSLLSTKVLSLTNSIPALNEQLTKLLDTPITTSTQPILDTEEDAPWGNSRAAYLNWTVKNRIASLPNRESGSSSNLVELTTTGTRENAEALSNAL